MSRFLETFAQISFLAIFAEAEKDVVDSHRSSLRSLSSSQPSCLVSFTSDFHLETWFSSFSPVKREKRGNGENH